MTGTGGIAGVLFTPALIASLTSAFIAAVSAFIAWRALRNTRAVARQRATLDLIEKVESTEHYRRLTSSFTAVARARRFEALVDPATSADREARLALIDYLNHYELIAIGIENDILDAAIYRQWMGSAFVDNWNDAADWIQRQRWKHDPVAGRWLYDERAYATFGRVAARWSRETRRLTPQSGAPPALPGGPGDDPPPRLDGDG